MAEALRDQRIFLTKDHDIGTLIFRDGSSHAGVILIDDTGAPAEEVALATTILVNHADDLSQHAFIRASRGSIRVIS